MSMTESFHEELTEEEALYEYTDADFGDTGGLRTDNPKRNRWQRETIHCEKPSQKFGKTVRTVLVVHGWKTPDKTEPMTLVVLSVKLRSLRSRFRFQSVRIWFYFDEDPAYNNTPQNSEAAPAVVAYAPFVTQQTWNQSEESIEKTTSTTGSVGVDMYAQANAERKREVKQSYTRAHFDCGSADLMTNDKDVHHGVEWYFEQNHIQEYGVKPEFYLAVLIKRQHTEEGKSIPFKATFDMDVEAGLVHDFQDGTKRLFRGGKPADEAVYYDPNLEDQIRGDNNAGEKLMAKVKKEHLGELLNGPDGNWLSALIDPTGGLSLDPIKPKTA